jgi:hypothetical protein
MYALLEYRDFAADFDSALAAANVVAAGTDSAATALIAAVDNSVSNDFFDMNPSDDA